MKTFPERTTLDGLESEIFKLVSRSATQEQWAKWLRPPLEHAAAEGNLDLVNKLVEAGADGSAGWRGCGGRTLLYAAATSGDEGVISSLLRQGSQPDVNVLSADGARSALYEATTHGHEAAARLLILAGADVDFSDPEHGHTALHDAIYSGHERLAKELVMSGANVNARDIYSATPLHHAARGGLEGVVSPLLLRGANKDAIDCEGCSALMKATKRGHLAIVETLLAAGADFNIRSTSFDLTAYSALDFAARKGYIPVLRALIRAGVDKDACSGSGTTALHVAADSGQEASIDALVEAGADIEVKCNKGRSPLHTTAKSGRLNALLSLLRQGATPSVRDGEGMTPLHLACCHQPEGLPSVVDFLLRWNADERALDSNGNKASDFLLMTHEDQNCSEDDVEHASALLSRAPADKAWRHRGWLVMLRARAMTARNTRSDERGDRDDRSVAGCESVGNVRGKASNKKGGAGGRIERGSLGDAVATLTELQTESVFRVIVGFLG